MLSEIPQIPREIGLDAVDLPDYSTLVKWFDRIKTALWRVLLRLTTQLYDPSGHAAIDTTFFERENASKHYCRRTNYHVQILKATALVDTATQGTLDVHCTTGKPHDTKVGWQVARRNAGDLTSLAADKNYDWMESRENLREEGVKPLIKHRTFRPMDHAHNSQVYGPRHCQRAMCEAVFSTIKRTLGDAVRARIWHGEFRELMLMCVAYKIKQTVS